MSPCSCTCRCVCTAVCVCGVCDCVCVYTHIHGTARTFNVCIVHTHVCVWEACVGGVLALVHPHLHPDARCFSCSLQLAAGSNSARLFCSIAELKSPTVYINVWIFALSVTFTLMPAALAASQKTLYKRLDICTIRHLHSDARCLGRRLQLPNGGHHPLTVRLLLNDGHNHHLQ